MFTNKLVERFQMPQSSKILKCEHEVTHLSQSTVIMVHLLETNMWNQYRTLHQNVWNMVHQIWINFNQHQVHRRLATRRLASWVMDVHKISIVRFVNT